MSRMFRGSIVTDEEYERTLKFEKSVADEIAATEAQAAADAAVTEDAVVSEGVDTDVSEGDAGEPETDAELAAVIAEAVSGTVKPRRVRAKDAAPTEAPAEVVPADVSADAAPAEAPADEVPAEPVTE